MSDTPYFPSLFEKPDCAKCEREDCYSRGKFQRDRRDFSYTSGRCPRLPDLRGFVDGEDRAPYAELYPLVHAERGEGDTVSLTLSRPVVGLRKVYMTYGQWWVRDHKNGEPVRRVLTIDGCYNVTDVLERMERARSDYCIFRCEMADYCL